jgi:hydrophobic/amphiphilic exporter-1 (mainly G- bacteria), HAE1 family
MSNKVRDYEAKIFEKVNPAVKFSVTRYVLTIGIFVAIVAFGFISLFGLGVDLFPTINIPVVVVSTTYSGADPSVIDQQVTQIIENTVSTLAGITDINSTSSVGSSRVIISFDQSSDKNNDANQVAALVSAAVRKLPSGVSVPIVQTFDPNSQPIVQFGISGSGASLGDVNDYVQNTLIPEMERVDGVANISTNGGPTRQFQVLLNPDRLRLYKLSPQSVVSSISSAAINQPIGTIISHNNALTFSTQNVPSNAAEISKVLVDTSRGLKVSDVASVRDVAVASDYARVNGKPVVLVSVQKASDANSVAVAASLRAMLKRVNLPKGYSIDISNDTTGPITASIDSTYRELFMTCLIVALIVLLFLGKLNTAFSVILAIPIALAASPILYKLSGFTLNLVSLLALITAIGIVVDDSIVVAENVERYRTMGFGLVESVLKGASEVFSAVVAASLSLLSVLIPVSFMGGFAGRYLMQFSLGLAAAVLFSLLEAILFLTVRLAYTPNSESLDWHDFARSFTLMPESMKWGLAAWKKPFGIVVGLALVAVAAMNKKYVFIPAIVLYPFALGIVYYIFKIGLSLLEALTTTLHNGTEAVVDWVREKYARSLGGIISHSIAVLIGSVIFLVGSAVFIFPHMPFNFMPQSDNGGMNVSVRLPPGSPLALTNEDVGRVEAFLLKQPEVAIVQTVVGSSGGFGGGAVSSNSGSMTVTLTPVGTRPNVYKMVPKYRAALLGLFKDQPSTRVSANASGSMGYQGAGMSIDLVSSNLDALTSGNSRFVQSIQQNPWVTDVNSSLSDTSLENDFIPDTSRFTGTGLTPNTVATTLQTYTSGTQASNVVSGGLSYPIEVQIDPTYLASGQSILNLPVYSSTLQTSLQVGQLGSFVLNEAPNRIARYNRMYSASFDINLKPGAPTVLEMQTMLENDLTSQGLLDNGVFVSSGGSTGMAALSKQLSQTGTTVFLLALFLCYLVMAAQFNSWRYPAYLLLPVPFALVGALWVVFMKGSGLDVFGIMGMVMLIGLSAKNAILYLDFVVERIGKMPLKDALVEAARLRFRPIVMTTLTVLVISFPLVFGSGQGAEFGQGLGMVMLGGVLFSAIMTFFVVPSAFYLFEKNRPSSAHVPEPEAKPELEEEPE